MIDLIKQKFTLNVQYSRIIEVLLRPKLAFSLMETEDGRMKWQTPIIVVSISAILVVIVSGFIKSRAASMDEVTLSPDFPNIQNNYMQAQQSMQGALFTYVFPLVRALLSLWIGWFILGGLMHLGSTLFGGRGSMQSALTITAYASLPFLVRDVLRLLYMLISQHAIQSFGLSGFVTNATFASHFLSRVDIFFIWSVILLILGFSVADNLSRSKSTANVLIVSITFLLIQSGAGILLSNVSRLANQSPFF